MRDIKFRAWCDDRKEMNSKVLVGNTCDQDSEDYTAHCIHIGKEWVNFDEHDDIHLMQFTGLTDKNGIEIYEGDIVDYASEWVDFVEFSEGNIWIASKQALTSTDLNMLCILVIGNIYQNPELIENNN